jgi:hypothetical protein
VTAIGYHRPGTLEAACRLMAEHGRRARLMAGGTALTILLKEGLLDADQIVSLDQVSLGGVSWDGGVLTTGAMVTHQALVEHPLVRAPPADTSPEDGPPRDAAPPTLAMRTNDAQDASAACRRKDRRMRPPIGAGAGLSAPGMAPCAGEF